MALDWNLPVTAQNEVINFSEQPKLKVGHFVYTIWQDEIVGRLPIIRLEGGALNPDSGKPRTLIYVQTPGEKLATPIPHTGHRGTRYYDGAGWAG